LRPAQQRLTPPRARDRTANLPEPPYGIRRPAMSGKRNEDGDVPHLFKDVFERLSRKTVRSILEKHP